MNILFTCFKSISHFKPLLPFAYALKTRGHDVRFAAADGLSDEITQRGFMHLVLDDPTEQMRDEFSKRMEGITPKDAGKIYVPEFFMAILASAALPGLIDALNVWRPDLIIREPTEFSGLVAAEKLGIRHVRLEILNGESEESIASKYHKEIDALRAIASLPPKGPGYLKDEMAFSAHPQALDDTARVNTRPPIRYFDGMAAPTAEPSSKDWMPQNDLPLIYATFGTVAAVVKNGGDIYRTALAAFADLPVNVLLTIGNEAPADLIKDVPKNVTVRSFVPQSEVLPHAKLMVCHGGSGTVVAGLAAGVPMVITPLFADQPDNARCLAAAHLCISVPDVNVASLRKAVIKALADDDMHKRVQSAAQRIADMPTLDQAIDLLLAS